MFSVEVMVVALIALLGEPKSTEYLLKEKEPTSANGWEASFKTWDPKVAKPRPEERGSNSKVWSVYRSCDRSSIC